MEGPVTSREREERGGAAADLEALRFDVVVRDGIAEAVQGEAEDERAGARAASAPPAAPVATCSETITRRAPTALRARPADGRP